MKVAVITGAANGIGLTLSFICLQKGITVVMVDKDVSKLEHEAQQLALEFPNQVFSIHCDITHIDEIEHLLEFTTRELGRVDWIYNNAGIIGELNPIWDLDPEQINQVINVNVYGMIHVIRTFIPFLFKQDFTSHIINIGSLYSLCSGSYVAPYAISKHAVLALSESLYFDLKRLNKPVDVSIAFPSFTDTSLFSTQANDRTALYQSLNTLLAHSRPAQDVAKYIIECVEQKQFYILPDKEVKGYCEDRIQSILFQDYPHLNAVEKLMGSLIKRSI